jgi:hypothetical protein
LILAFSPNNILIVSFLGNLQVAHRYLFVLLVLLFGLIGCGGGSSDPTPDPTSTPTAQIEKNQLITSKVSGNTASFNAIATFYVSLDKKPSADVVIPLSSSDTGEGVVDVNELRFTPNNWNRQQRVVVKGRNSNVVDGKQDYKIVLGTIESDDKSYDGVNPDDVKMKGIYLKLNKITDSTTFISGLESTIDISADYTGNNKLVYSLDKKPDGMIVNEDSGQITWNASDSMEGNNYDVKVKVTDGNLVSELNINISVASLTPIKSKLSGDTVTITESGNLNGLIVTKVDYDTNIRDIEFKKISKESVRDVPSFVTKITDTFVIRNQIKGKIKIKLPLSSLPSGSNLYHLFLYRLTTNSDFSHSFWSPTLIDREISETNGKPVIEIILTGLKGVYFIGIEKDEIETHNTSLEKSTQIFSKDVNIDGIKCNSINIVNMPKDKMEREAYNEQNCIFKSKYTDKIFNVRVIGFGDSKNSERWSIKIERLVGWLRDAQDGFRSLHLSYDDSITVFIHKLDVRDNEENVGLEGGDGHEDNFTLGYVSSDENRKTLHITQKDKSTNLMKATSIHEYFHHAQSRSRSDNKDLLIEGEGSEGTWMIEGTAGWFMDYQHDSDNIYRDAINGIRILENGLLSKDNDYPNSYFFKLINSKCNGKLKFTEIIQKLFNIDKEQDLTGVKNLKKQLAEAECDFGNQLGINKKSTLESALLYYQYASLYENNISLLDSNEDKSEFDFFTTPYTLTPFFNEENARYLVNESQVNRLLGDKKNIPAYGAYSVRVKISQYVETQKVFLTGITQDNKPLMISIIEEKNTSKEIPSRQIKGKENGFKGIPTHEINGKEHIHYRTDEKSEHIFKETKLNSYFITILNPNDSIVTISELVIKSREKDTKLKADAGKDKVIWEGEEVVLDASGSKGNNLDYIWKLAESFHTESYREEFVVVDSLGVGKDTTATYEYELTVTGNQGTLDTDEVSITVKKRLVADAGINQIIPMGNEIKLDGSRSKGATSWEWREGGIVLGRQKNITISELSEGEHEIVLTVKNSFDDEATDKVWVTVTKALQLYLEANIEGESKRTIEDGTPLHLNASNSSGAVKYTWKEGDSILFESKNSLYTIQHLPVDGSPHTITLIVTSRDGRTESSSIEVTVKPKIVPTPTPTPTPRPIEPPKANFDGTYWSDTGKFVATDTSTSDSGICKWYWEWGDGFTDKVQNPIHYYSLSGSYRVKLTVTDCIGKSSSFSPDSFRINLSKNILGGAVTDEEVITIKVRDFGKIDGDIISVWLNDKIVFNNVTLGKYAIKEMVTLKEGENKIKIYAHNIGFPLVWDGGNRNINTAEITFDNIINNNDKFTWKLNAGESAYVYIFRRVAYR